MLNPFNKSNAKKAAKKQATAKTKPKANAAMPKHPRIDDEAEDQIIASLKRGISPLSIAMKHKVKQSYVENVAAAIGVEVKQKKEDEDAE